MLNIQLIGLNLMFIIHCILYANVTYMSFTNSVTFSEITSKVKKL